MFTQNNPYQQYREARVQTAGQLELIIMMYDGAIRFINLAKKAIAEKNYIEANNSLKRVQDIIDELNYSLNMDAGEIAENLRKLYEFINRQVVEANIKKDVKTLNNVLELINTLKSSWVELQNMKRKAVSGE